MLNGGCSCTVTSGFCSRILFAFSNKKCIWISNEGEPYLLFCIKMYESVTVACIFMLKELLTYFISEKKIYVASDMNLYELVTES